MPDQSFGRHLRLRTPTEFDRVYTSKVYAADDTLVINAAANDLTHPRLGLSVSKKVGNAVVRNRWKRLIREAFRLEHELLPAGVDLVIRPQKNAVADLEAIRRSLPALARRVVKRLHLPTSALQPPTSG